MKKEELIERIIDTFTDMGSEDPEDTAYADELTLPEARTYLSELRANEKASLEPDEWLPAEITPELYMEAFNCYLRRCRYEVTLHRLEKFIEYGELVDVYHEFDGRYISDTDKTVYPTGFLSESIEFPFTCDDLTMLDLITLGQNSPDFNPNAKFCWYDITNHELHSTNAPFEDGLIDARAFAAWILEHPGRISYIKDWCMLNTGIDYIFRYWRG